MGLATQQLAQQLILSAHFGRIFQGDVDMPDVLVEAAEVVGPAPGVG